MKSYVCYERANGEILAVLNHDPTSSFSSILDWAYIEVDIEQVMDILSGAVTPKSFVVEYSNLHDARILKPRQEFEIEELNIDDLIYKIPQVSIREEQDIIIIQDITNTCWKILISPMCEGELRGNFVNLKYIMHFAITKYNNPNILYRLLEIDLEQLVKNHYQIVDFQYDFETTDLPVSVFTMKRFDTYCYIRNDE